MGESSVPFERLGLPRARRHVFICAGPKCCAEAEGAALWEHAKQAIRTHAVPTLRSRVNCLRVCTQGPWMVVYPEGTWYAEVTPERFDCIRREHLEGGVPVAKWVRCSHPLAGG